MGARGDKEREIAAEEREQAARVLHLIEQTTDPSSLDDLTLLVQAHQEAARLHEALAVMYDREDEA